MLQLAVAAAMYWRKLHRAFPVFFAYLVSQIMIFSVLFPMYRSGNYALFFYTYWICASTSLAIGFKVIHEIFQDVFRPYHTLKDLGSVMFKWAALVMLLVGLVVAAGSTSDLSPFVQAVMTVQRCVRVIQCGLILFLLVFSRYLGVSWRQTSFGIALGFGSFAAVELTMATLHASGHASQTVLNFAIMVAYNFAILVWLTYGLVKSPARENACNLLMSQRWEQSLTDLRQPAIGDSLIPMFEGMVDRALSRTNRSSVCEDLAAARPAPIEMTPAGKSCPQFAPRRFASKT